MVVNKGKFHFAAVLKMILEGEIILPSSFELLRVVQAGLLVLPDSVWVKGPDGEILYLQGGKYNRLSGENRLIFTADLLVFEADPNDKSS